MRAKVNAITKQRPLLSFAAWQCTQQRRDGTRCVMRIVLPACLFVPVPCPSNPYIPTLFCPNGLALGPFWHTLVLWCVLTTSRLSSCRRPSKTAAEWGQFVFASISPLLSNVPLSSAWLWREPFNKSRRTSESHPSEHSFHH